MTAQGRGRDATEQPEATDQPDAIEQPDAEPVDGRARSDAAERRDRDERPHAAGPHAAGPRDDSKRHGDGGRSLVTVNFPAEAASGEPIDGVALVLLDRPKALNALNAELLSELVAALRSLDDDAACRCIVISGAGERAFAAGADIREMKDETPASLRVHDRFARWDEVAAVRTPTIAAVRGYALGGGLELALGCDMIVAGDDAVFGQPEINLGVIPGAGGTQRLTRAIGKARAAELILTGRTVGAAEAERLGFVTRVVPAAETLAAALELAATIAAKAPLAVLSAVDAIRAADELPLSAGITHERRDFHLLFGTEDQREGMAAFLEKRPPTWKGK